MWIVPSGPTARAGCHCSLPEVSSFTRTGLPQELPLSSDRETRMSRSAPIPSAHARRTSPRGVVTIEGKGRAHVFTEEPEAEPGRGLTRESDLQVRPPSTDRSDNTFPDPGSHHAAWTTPPGAAERTTPPGFVAPRSRRGTGGARPARRPRGGRGRGGGRPLGRARPPPPRHRRTGTRRLPGSGARPRRTQGVRSTDDRNRRGRARDRIETWTWGPSGCSGTTSPLHRANERSPRGHPRRRTYPLPSIQRRAGLGDRTSTR